MAGLVDEPLGTALYATNAVASSIVPAQGVDSYLLSIKPGADHTQIRNEITGINGVVAYQDTNAIVGIVDQYLGLFYAFIGVMIALGSVLALAMIYVTMAVSVAERTGELATLSAAGVSVGKVARTIATENLLATTLGIPFGLGLGVLAARAFLGSLLQRPIQPATQHAVVDASRLRSRCALGCRSLAMACREIGASRGCREGRARAGRLTMSLRRPVEPPAQ